MDTTVVTRDGWPVPATARAAAQAAARAAGGGAEDGAEVAPGPDTTALLAGVQQTARVNPVFGEPISAHGVTIVTAARVGTGVGAGGGSGPDDEGRGSGGGGGFGGRPVGAFVLSEGTVRWQPAVDVNRLVVVVAAVAVLALLTARRLARTQGAAGRYLR